MTIQKHIIIGGADHFLPHLKAAINKADSIDIAVAFIKSSGLVYLLPALEDALAAKCAVRILTGDYLHVTEPQALNQLMTLKEKGASVRVFETKGKVSFHLKTYIFTWGKNGQLEGQAFVGSSNISHAALTDGVEWNLSVERSENPQRFDEVHQQFVHLFNGQESVELTPEWIGAYQLLYRPSGDVRVASEELPPAEPNNVQIEALKALRDARLSGIKRGLVVLATGLGKTWLSAFDAQQAKARRILFVAHREEILDQAEATYARLFPNATLGKYTGQEKAPDVQILFASIQTLGRKAHLELFSPGEFDYIVVDEFHHAAANSYQGLLRYFQPKFLLGLTATPDRTDQADILELCDGNLIYQKDLIAGVREGFLCPFHYLGVHDQYVDYSRIAWRGQKFDEQQLEDSLTTNSRAMHAYREWQAHGQAKTLAFCVSKKHAEFMAVAFKRMGVNAAAVHSASELRRNEALDGLESGRFQVIFSVDLFNEGIDVPSIDTVLMLRPTESKILFLQQLGRGLRKSSGKAKLKVIDFIGNHYSFLRKPEALLGISPTAAAVNDYITRVQEGTLDLPPACEIEYELEAIDLLKKLLDKLRGTVADNLLQLYEALKASKDRRPTATEMLLAGANFARIRQQWGSWLDLVQSQNDLSETEATVVSSHRDFFRTMETTNMTKSFKMVLLEAFIELNGFQTAPTIHELATHSFSVLQRRPILRRDLPEPFLSEVLDGATTKEWVSYWRKNPIAAFIGESGKSETFFRLEADRFLSKLHIDGHLSTFETLLQEIVHYRLQSYTPRIEQSKATSLDTLNTTPVFKTLDAAKAYLNGSGATDGAFAIENLPKAEQGIQYFVIHPDTAQNLISGAIPAGEAWLCFWSEKTGFSKIRQLARLELALHQPLMRESIPGLFNMQFNPGLWQSGHVSPKDAGFHVLFVTLNKAGQAIEHLYADAFTSADRFNWQSQNKTEPESRAGQRIKYHERNGEQFYLFVRKDKKLPNGKGAPFYYCGELHFESWAGSKPISVKWKLKTPLSGALQQEFGIHIQMNAKHSE